jgi:hypothetical protein
MMNREHEMSTVIVEQSLAVPLEAEDCRELSQTIACFRVLNVHFVASYLSEQRNRIICHFQAPDVESVRQALRGAGIGFDRIWSAKVMQGPERQVSRDGVAIHGQPCVGRVGSSAV